MWRVVVAAHTIAEGRYSVGLMEAIVGEEDSARAKMRVLRWAHSDSGVPPWKPYLRKSWPHVTAERHVSAREEDLERMREAQRRRDAGAGGSTLQA